MRCAGNTSHPDSATQLMRYFLGRVYVLCSLAGPTNTHDFCTYRPICSLLKNMKVEHVRLRHAPCGGQGFAVRVRFFWRGIKMELGRRVDVLLALTLSISLCFTVETT